ncbi:MAG: hypothetical protein MPEBLZ_04447, partial [Candidatus Methanoperedens nitroreducens]
SELLLKLTEFLLVMVMLSVVPVTSNTPYVSADLISLAVLSSMSHAYLNCTISEVAPEKILSTYTVNRSASDSQGSSLSYSKLRVVWLYPVVPEQYLSITAPS